MTRIIGIDPGSNATGYGIVDADRRRSVLVAHACLRTRGEDFAQRLKQIFDGLVEVIETHRPEVMAVESVFVSRNASSALKLGQARGAAICAGVSRELAVSEYTPREVKQALVGTGGADKAQVQHMVGVLLNVKGPLQADAADALAVALCHSHTAATRARLSTLAQGW